MRRREFITLIGVAAAAWPLAAAAQQSARMRRIGILMAYAESDTVYQGYVIAFQEELQKLGWEQGRNIRFNYGWAGSDLESINRFAKELVALQPDLILSSSTPTTASLLQQTQTIPIIFANIIDPSPVVSSPVYQGPVAMPLATLSWNHPWPASGQNCSRKLRRA